MTSAVELMNYIYLPITRKVDQKMKILNGVKRPLTSDSTCLSIVDVKVTMRFPEFQPKSSLDMNSVQTP